MRCLMALGIRTSALRHVPVSDQTSNLDHRNWTMRVRVSPGMPYLPVPPECGQRRPKALGCVRLAAGRQERDDARCGQSFIRIRMQGSSPSVTTKLGCRPMVGRRTLDPHMVVRVDPSQPCGTSELMNAAVLQTATMHGFDSLVPHNACIDQRQSQLP